MKRFFIINPKSGRQIRNEEIAELERYFKALDGVFHFCLTKSREDIIDQTKSALYQGYDQIVAVGGDGTVHQVINGFFQDGKLINPNAILAISNTGSGSDYFRTLSAPEPVSDWKTIVHSHDVRRVDLGLINFLDGDLPNQYFNNMVGIGLGAEIVVEKNNLPLWVPRILIYPVATFLAFRKRRAKKVKIDGLEFHSQDNKMLSAFVSKGVFAGGGMKFGEDFSGDSGLFTMTHISMIGIRGLLQHFFKLYKGHFDGIPFVSRNSVSFVKLEFEDCVDVELDGEWIGKTKIFDISLISKILPVCFAKKGNADV